MTLRFYLTSSSRVPRLLVISRICSSSALVFSSSNYSSSSLMVLSKSFLAFSPTVILLASHKLNYVIAYAQSFILASLSAHKVIKASALIVFPLSGSRG